MFGLVWWFFLIVVTKHNSIGFLEKESLDFGMIWIWDRSKYNKSTAIWWIWIWKKTYIKLNIPASHFSGNFFLTTVGQATLFQQSPLSKLFFNEFLPGEQAKQTRYTN